MHVFMTSKLILNVQPVRSKRKPNLAIIFNMNPCFSPGLRSKEALMHRLTNHISEKVGDTTCGQGDRGPMAKVHTHMICSPEIWHWTNELNDIGGTTLGGTHPGGQKLKMLGVFMGWTCQMCRTRGHYGSPNDSGKSPNGCTDCAPNLVTSAIHPGIL